MRLPLKWKLIACKKEHHQQVGEAKVVEPWQLIVGIGAKVCFWREETCASFFGVVIVWARSKQSVENPESRDSFTKKERCLRRRILNEALDHAGRECTERTGTRFASILLAISPLCRCSPLAMQTHESVQMRTAAQKREISLFCAFVRF